jgi:hypothetical protein
MTNEEFHKQFEEDYWQTIDDELNGYVPLFITDVYIECICGRGFYTNPPDRCDGRCGKCPECKKIHYKDITNSGEDITTTTSEYKMPQHIPILQRIDTYMSDTYISDGSEDIPILNRIDALPYRAIHNIFQYAFKEEIFEDIFVDENNTQARGRKFSYPPPSLVRSTNSFAYIKDIEDKFDDILRQYEPSSEK